MSDCIFCKIAEGLIPADKLLENEHCIVFKDIRPAAPVHLLVIPRKHIASVEELHSDDADVVAQLLLAAKEAAGLAGVSETGYRVVINTGEHAGQEVKHLHLHVLGGRRLKWPPG